MLLSSPVLLIFPLSWLVLIQATSEIPAFLDAPGVGIAYTGGGIPGILEALCTHEALGDLVPGFKEMQLTVSSASGGSLGYLLHRSASNLEYPPSLSANLSYDTLKSDKSSPGFTYWARVAEWLPHHISTLQKPTLDSLSAQPDPQKSWWRDVMAALFEVPYGVPKGKEGQLGVGRYIQTFAVIEQGDCLPMQRDSMGFMIGAAGCLHFGSLETSPGVSAPLLQINGGLTFSPVSESAFTMLDGAAWTSAFYASSIIENLTTYRAERVAEAIDKGLLISTPARKSNSSAISIVHLIDGGFVDTTGIAAQLQRQTRRIFVSYGVNRCLGLFAAQNQCENASIATLFGVLTPTDDMDSVAGRLVQVFDSSLYEGLYANLTNQSKLLARLTNVQVLQNDYLDVKPYVLEELIILSNARSDTFLDTFTDPDVKKNIDSNWPDRFPLSMDAFNANMMCQFQRWKLQRNSVEINNFFSRPARDVYL